MFELRAYQIGIGEEVHSCIDQGLHTILVASPTGSGKTVMYADIVMKRGVHARVVTYAAELRDDLQRRLYEMGLNIPVDTAAKVLHEAPSATELLILDEVHHFLSNSGIEVMERIQAQTVLGFTATPYRADLRPLLSENGGPFECFIEGPTIAELTAQGCLANLVIETVGLEEVVRQYAMYRGQTIVGYKDVVTVEPADLSDQVVDEYTSRFRGQSAIAFCRSIDHAEQVAQDFCTAGVPATTIHGRISKGIIQDRMASMRSGADQVLTVCQMGTEGIDIDRLKVAIMLRKITGSMRLYVQGVGRILRVYNGETAHLLDLVGNVHRYGDPSEITAGDYAA